MSHDLADHIPALKYNRASEQTWGTAGNTKTVTDGAIKSTSKVLIHHTTIPNGRWKVVCSDGSFTVTSSDAESASLTFEYIIL